MEFIRKRDEYKDKRLMRAVFAILVLTGVLTLASFYHEDIEKKRKEKKAEKETIDLQHKVEIATHKR